VTAASSVVGNDVEAEAEEEDCSGRGQDRRWQVDSCTGTWLCCDLHSLRPVDPAVPCGARHIALPGSKSRIFSD
jgi:hypothetical protein